MTAASRKALAEVYGILLREGWDEPAIEGSDLASRPEGPARSEADPQGQVRGTIVVAPGEGVARPHGEAQGPSRQDPTSGHEPRRVRPSRTRSGVLLEDTETEPIANKVGGRFKLSTLIQKRMIALNGGAQPMVDARGLDKMSIVIQEIMQDKIHLDMAGNVRTSEEIEEIEDGGTVDLTQPSE